MPDLKRVENLRSPIIGRLFVIRRVFAGKSPPFGDGVEGEVPGTGVDVGEEKWLFDSRA